MRFLAHYLKPFYGWMALGLFIKATGSLIELTLPYILSHILDNVVPGGQISQVLVWGGIMLACALFALIFNVIANRMAARVAKESSRVIRHDLFKKTLSLSSSQIDRITVPSLESRLTTDTYNVHHFVGMMQRLGVRAPLLMIGGLIVTWMLDRTLTLVMMATLPLICLVIGVISAKGIPLYTRVQRSNDNMIRIVREDAQGIRVINALSRTDDERARFETANKALVASEKKAGYTMALSNPLITLLLNIGLVGVIVIGAVLVNRSASQPGRIVAFIQYFTLITNAMLAVTRLFVQYSKGVASARRIEEIINLEPDVSVLPQDEVPASEGIPADGIYFDDVSFSYNGVRDNISHLTFHIPSGKSLGIIGPTGSGKSTVALLLMRFYDPTQGRIFINGRDIRTIPLDELSATFGAVMQNGFIFNDTIEENISFGRDIPHERITACCRTAQADEFIESFPESYARELTFKGTNVSGGQRQRILIARALAGDPSILILDDASSALDYQTDARLRQALAQDYPGTTSVIIAQRVSSVKSCATILVLESGKVIGQGDHETLMRTCPEYAEISHSQMGGDLLD
ncbi:MAG: ABC transporter ATP-binding protein [Clostridia bacterium]|nr:ABC transporter ATP-binding protein [Clostridia bacterium]